MSSWKKDGFREVHPVADLPRSFRETAEYLREHAASEHAACAWEKAAEILEDALGELQIATITLDEAEAESGYSRGHLRRLIREGVVPNSGTENHPRILRRDVPRKPGHGVRQDRSQDVTCLTQVARVIARGGT